MEHFLECGFVLRARLIAKVPTYHPIDEASHRPLSSPVQPILEIGHRIVGHDRLDARRSGGDQEAEDATLRIADRPQAIGVDPPVSENHIERSGDVGRIAPGEQIAFVLSSQHALVVGGYRQVPAVGQIQDHSAHVDGGATRRRMNEDAGERAGRARRCPFEVNPERFFVDDLRPGRDMLRCDFGMDDMRVHAAGE